ncbi:MAG: pirin family protein [Thiohalomonadales bacterium]
MKNRSVTQLISANRVTEGAGVTVYRTIGTAALRNLDPFLMMDFFCSDDPNDYIAGFPDHPHRGFSTFTYMLDGHMLHQDSMGSKGDLQSGGAQWMKAASGVIHSEMPQQSHGLMRGFQLWVNLPAKEKMTEPHYQDINATDVPCVEVDAGKIKVLIGEYEGQQGPVKEANPGMLYLDIQLEPEGLFQHKLDAELTCFIYVFEGELSLNSSPLEQHSFAVLGEGQEVSLRTKRKPARLLLVAGYSIKEPIEQQGPFVMNTPAEIRQAFEDYRSGNLVREKILQV